MRTIMILVCSFVAFCTWTACKQAKGSIDAIDLETGKQITVVKDSSTGRMVNAETRKPVKLFVNRQTNDTIYGKTGEVVNNKLHQSEQGEYVYYNSDEAYKMKKEQDGGYKIKRGDDYKVKYQNGEYKVKHGNYKKKVEKDGDVTIKRGERKVKIDGETGEVKVKN